MRIEHAAVYVRDLQGAKEFFRIFLGAEAGMDYHNPATGFLSCFLTFDGGARLEVMNRPGLGDNGSPEGRTGLSHLAFSAGSREGVDELTERLKSGGYRVQSGPRVTGDGYYESCVIGFEGNLIEITV